MAVHAGRHDDRLGLGQQHHVRVGNPVGRRDDDLIAGIEHGLAHIVEALLAAAGNQYLVSRIVQPVVAFEFRYNGFFKCRGTVNRRIAGEAVLDGLDTSGLDVVRCIEVRLAGAESDNILAGSAQFRYSCRYCQGWRGFDALYAICQCNFVQGCIPYPRL